MPHILLIGNDEEICRMLSFFLQEEGYKVTTVANERNAIEQLHKQMPDIILLNLMMSDVEEEELCWQLRLFSSVPILVISDKNEDKDIFITIESGADDYIAKPFTIPELITRIKILLYRHATNLSKSDGHKHNFNLN